MFHPLRNDFSAFYVVWFQKLAKEMGLESPIEKPSDLLFDYPELLRPCLPDLHFDYLICNSTPLSLQFRAYDEDYFKPLVKELLKRGKRVAITQNFKDMAELRPAASPDAISLTNSLLITPDQGLSMTQIGNLSMRCDCIIGISNGPMWPTYNVWNRNKKRIITMDNGELLNLDGETQALNLMEVFQQL